MVSLPKSSRLKNKLRGVGETMIKETFVQNMIQNNNLLSILLDDGSSCVILPQRTSDPLYSSFHLKLQMNIKPRIALGLCSGEDKMEGNSVPYLSTGSRGTWTRHLNGFSPPEENSLSVYQRRNSSMTKVSRFESSGFHHSTSEMQHIGEVQTNKFRTDGFLDKGLLSCVTCGILNYACVAVIQPREATAGYLMSTDFNSFANQIVGFEEKCDLTNDVIRKTLDSDVDINIGNREMIHSSHHVPVYNYDFLSDAKVERGASALDLLASVYGDLSDSEEAAVHDMSVCTDGNRIIHSSPTCNLDQKSTCRISSESISHNRLPSKGATFGNPNDQSRATGICTLSKLVHSTKVLAESCYEVGSFSQLHGNCKDENVSEEKMWFLAEKLHDNIAKAVPNSLVDNSKIANNSLIEAAGNLQYPGARRDLGSTYEIDQTAINSNDMMLKQLNSDSSVFHHRCSSNDSAITGNTTSASFCTLDDSVKNSCMAIVQASDRDSSRMHVFCLEHAVEVEKRLRAIGGVNMLLLCHPEYPKMESEAKLLAKELGLKHHWKDVPFRNSTEQDQEKIRIAIDDEEVIPCNGDWTVKLGINLYYSVNLSKSPLFRKQLPYNEVIYKSFAQKLPVEQKSSGRVPRRQKKIILAGKWCGKVWMSNQVHPFLADLNITDHDEIDQKSDEVERDIENENQSILPKRCSSNNSAAARTKSSKKRKNSAFRSSTRKPARTRLDNSSDTGYAEDHSVSADGDPDTDLKSEDDTDIEDEKQVIQLARNSANDSAAARMKSSKKVKILTVRSRTRKSAHTRLENSSDSGCGEKIFGYADDEPDTDQKSEADSYIEDEKKAILPRRNSTKDNASARRISVKRRNKLAVSSSTRKHSHTRIDDSSDDGYAEENSAYADGDPELDQRLGDATDIENDKQAILPRRNSMNNNATARRKSIKKWTESVVRSSTRKPAHTRLDNSSDTGYAEENPGYVDNDQDETDLDSEKQEILPRGNLTNNNSTRRKSGRKRKRSMASCTRKPAHTRLDSSGGAGHAEVDSSAKCGRNLSCLRSTSKGSTRKPPSMQLRKRWLKSGEAKTIVAPEKCNKKKRLKKAPDSDPGKEDYPCDVEGCCMSFATKHDLGAHKRNVCPEKGCGKKFFSHKYLLQHQKVHSDDRPLKCPWKGCKMTFKWAWARTEHIRVHTGERPYVCGEPGCEQTFRFVSDFSRHRRKTGHCSAKKGSA